MRAGMSLAAAMTRKRSSMRRCGSGCAAAKTTTTWSTFATTTPSPYAPPGARRARADRRAPIAVIVQALAAVPRLPDCSGSPGSITTSSPTASLSVPACLSRPRNVTSRVRPSSSRTCHTPPVPRRTTAFMRRSFLLRLLHRFPPWPSARPAALAHDPIEKRLHLLQCHGANLCPNVRFAHAPRQEIGFDMTRDVRRARTPAYEQQKRAHRRRHVTRLIGLDLYGICRTVRTLERRRARVHRRVAANRVLVAFRVIRREELAHSTPTSTPRAEQFAHNVAGNERHVGRTLCQAAHEIRIPLRPERNIHTHVVALPHELFLQVATHSVEHLEFESFGADLVFPHEAPDPRDDRGIVRGQSRIVPLLQELFHAFQIGCIHILLGGK